MHKALTAIVIDDYADMIEVFCEHLETLDVKVIGRGCNGKDAVELYQRKRPDIVFLDLMMPEYDGFYALENIRRLDPASRVAIVTADMRGETAKKLEELRPTKIFLKPHDIDQIRLFVEELQGQMRTVVQPNKFQNALVSFVIYETLRQAGESIVDEVGNRLYAKYGSYFADCLEHPEYLRDILREIFGDACKPIMDAIKEKLVDHTEQKQISNFLVILDKG